MQLDPNEANKLIAFQAYQLMQLTMLNQQKDQALQQVAQRNAELEEKAKAAAPLEAAS